MIQPVFFLCSFFSSFKLATYYIALKNKFLRGAPWLEDLIRNGEGDAIFMVTVVMVMVMVTQ